MNRSGPNHAEIVVEMGEEWNYSSNHGEWRRAVRAIAAYLFSTTSRHDALYWMKYIDEHTDLDDFHYSNDPYNC
jgi:hypothetical protein